MGKARATAQQAEGGAAAAARKRSRKSSAADEEVDPLTNTTPNPTSSSSRKKSKAQTAAGNSEQAAAGADAQPKRRGRPTKSVTATAAAAEKPAAKTKPAAAAAAAASSKRKAGSGASKAAAAAAAAAAGGGGANKPKPPYYLVKSEPDEFSIDMLKSRPQQTEGWEGVRNYVARNHLRAMKLGDQAFFYHSSCKTPGIVGIVEVVREAYPDLTAQDSSSKYFDPKASAEDPRWSMVDFKLVRELSRPITLEELKTHKDGALSGMALFTTARLSVQPVSKAEWDFVLGLEGREKE